MNPGRVAFLIVAVLVVGIVVFAALYYAFKNDGPSRHQRVMIDEAGNLVALPDPNQPARTSLARRLTAKAESAARWVATVAHNPTRPTETPAPTQPPAAATQEVRHLGWEDTPDAPTEPKERHRRGAHADPGTAAWPTVAHSTGKHAATDAMNPAEVAEELARTSDLSDETVAAIVREHHKHAGLPVAALDRRIAAARAQAAPQSTPVRSPAPAPTRPTWDDINNQNQRLRAWVADPDRTGLMPRVDSHEGAA